MRTIIVPPCLHLTTFSPAGVPQHRLSLPKAGTSPRRPHFLCKSGTSTFRLARLVPVATSILSHGKRSPDCRQRHFRIRLNTPHYFHLPQSDSHVGLMVASLPIGDFARPPFGP